MASTLRTPTLGLTALSMCLCLAIIGTAGRSLNIYYNQHSENPWLLPLWPNHFDIRELQMLVAVAAVIVVCNAVLGAGLMVKQLPANGLVIVSALLSTIVSVISIIFTTVLNYRAPKRDTVQTWTCRWTLTPRSLNSLGVPEEFYGLCAKTRFAYFSTIPVLVIQLALLGLGIWALFARRPQRSGHEELEKGAHPLRNVNASRPRPSFETNGSLRSYQDSTRILAGQKQ